MGRRMDVWKLNWSIRKRVTTYLEVGGDVQSHGHMCADEVIGLHFPASDIPKQARDLYKINRIRILYDRDEETARLVSYLLLSRYLILFALSVYLSANTTFNRYVATSQISKSLWT